MGGSSGSTFSRSSPSDLQREIREAELQASEEAFLPILSETLDDFLSRVNDRNVDEINERLQDAKEVLKDSFEEAIDLRYGGSVAKHTYVDGLSDVDSLLIMRADSTADVSPKELLNKAAAQLAEALPAEVEVSRGKIAVTLSYPFGAEIQLVPAVRVKDKLHVPSWRSDKWSKINPESFTRGLTKRNEEVNGKLIPTIKLAKAINAKLPDTQQLTGYHIESLAISAFRGYDGPKTVARMLPEFFRKIPQLLHSAIKDKTGQSVHVDQYLGGRGSPERLERAHVFRRIGRRMGNATAARSLDQWRSIISE